MSAGDFLPTGVPGVDELLEGKGPPRGYNIFVLGSPGSGKTTFGLQFLSEGIRKYGENGVYISLDEDMPHVKTNASRVGIDLETMERADRLSFR